MIVEDLKLMGYREAWERQECAHEAVVAGGEERLLLVEHRAVITFGRRAEAAAKNLVASAGRLAEMGVEVVESDRGGDITFHGPGQLVVYPIVRLNEHGLSVGGYVRKLEEVMIAALGELGVGAKKDKEAIGVWAEGKKICALGVRIKRGVSLHGVALNVTTDLRYFDLIVPCGLSGRGVTSLEKVLGKAPAMEKVKRVVVEKMKEAFE
ncbi:MAG TPA: lipoyl(octanoyl) transferase LipB [Tepidisphaeraceae bacterium]|jgi:lipoate-protein ligase B|nr:lipoyl(octanoyl) transferase LipB [Tepidisphaeraceae bacterium]